ARVGEVAAPRPAGQAVQHHAGQAHRGVPEEARGEAAMKTTIYGLLISASTIHNPDLAGHQDNIRYRFMSVLVQDENGKPVNEKFFLGRLPKQGEAVEMVFMGTNAEGAMIFQLRVKK